MQQSQSANLRLRSLKRATRDTKTVNSWSVGRSTGMLYYAVASEKVDKYVFE